MTQLTQVNTIIRDRGQITLPNRIRKTRKWVSPRNVVTITSDKPDEIVIRPYTATKKYDWDKIWEGIKRARAIKGKGGNLSKFIAEDRYRH